MLIRVTVARYKHDDIKAIRRDLVTLGLAQNVSESPEGIQGDYVHHNREGCYLVCSRVVLLQSTHECHCKMEVVS